MPIFPFMLYALLMIFGHFLLGHDPRFNIKKNLFYFLVFAYLIFIWALPKHLKSKWQAEKNLLDADDILDAPPE